ANRASKAETVERFIYFSKNVDSVSSLGFLHQECCVLRLTSDHRDHRCVSRRSLSCRVRPFRPERDCDRGNDRLRGAGVLQVQYTRSELSVGAVQRSGRRRLLPCGRWIEPGLLCCAYRVRRRGRRSRSRPYQAAPVELMDPMQ
ncbi:hypothetical protein MUK42_28770, partial [Musa troglodytarum]